MTAKTPIVLRFGIACFMLEIIDSGDENCKHKMYTNTISYAGWHEDYCLNCTRLIGWVRQ